MLELIDALFGLITLLSTWRLAVCVLASFLFFACFCWIVQPGDARVLPLIVFTTVGAAVGLLWQIRHERVDLKEKTDRR